MQRPLRRLSLGPLAPPHRARTFIAWKVQRVNPIAIRVIELTLLAAGTDLLLVSENGAFRLQLSDARRLVVRLKHDRVPSFALLALAARQGTGTTRSETAQDQFQNTQRDLAECG